MAPTARLPYPQPTITVSCPRPDVTLVVLGGEHDLASAPAVERALHDALRSSSHLVVDLSAAAFIDSSIIKVLVGARTKADEAERAFNLVLDGASSPIERTLEICGVLPVLNRVSTVDAALTPARDPGVRRRLGAV